LLIDVPEWRQDILEEHFDELESLLDRRIRSERSPDLDGIALERIDARVDAHVDALVLAGEHAWPMIEPALGSEDLAPAAAASLVIATSANPVHEKELVSAFAKSSGATLAGLLASLELRAGPRLRDALTALEAPPLVASAAWSIAAPHDAGPGTSLLARWRQEEDPRVRGAAWRIEARLARDDTDRLKEPEWRAGLADTDAGVRRWVLWGAARSGQPWLLDHLRESAARPASSVRAEHRLLAILGDATDAARVLPLVRNKTLGLDRLRLLPAFGFAPAVEELLRIMREGTPLEGALAADAFFRITGVRADRPERIAVIEPGPEPGAVPELADEARICDAAAAARAWSTLKARIGPIRWIRGMAADALPPQSLPKIVDLEARWGLQLRAAARRSAAHLAWDSERFPFS
jgi:hypothetical protein